MTILEILKKLHKKMTGKESEGKSITNILTSLEENYTGGGTSGSGSDLPTPGTAGNVLTSNGTSWESAAPQSGLPDTTSASVGDVVTLGESGAEWAAPKGAEKYEVILTKDEDMGEDPVYTATHDGVVVSGADIIAAYNAGKNVMLKYGVDGIVVVGNVADCENDAITFTCFGGGEEEFCTASVSCILDEEEGDFWVEFSTKMPYSSIATDGKLLCVNHGAYVLVDGIPTYDTTTDLGKVLTVTANGLTWITPQ